ncbi:winged helix-turn-helix domain-containing protein [Saccharopolyspora indica]|uniref:BTAD domain-containing putative transcriptional regulator n=1 Tax=Saccharopolyspora indica TaxID=1229659 RepID=UPI0022EA8C9E|nr:BTAD domain-containing putative transcriptional regulator [Saccharopolyspora indica]MDA3647476.1 BTAD domain-containing putative transcriptional regulator [Saccharopolyspora indica]
MRYGVLGPLTAWDTDGRAVRVPEAKVRALLAILLAHGGGPVSADRLVAELWADAPPATPLNTLQSKVSQLRRALGRDQVLHQPAGYRLLVDQVDAHRFQELVERARAAGSPRVRADLLDEALALWRGPAYADFADAPFARAEITRLEELRLAAVEDRAEARLELGQHAAVAAELGDLVGSHPLRERLRMAQMRALYRSGRQTEALSSFHELRRELGDELGVAPGPELTALHEAMLRHEPHLAPPAASRDRSNLPTPLTPIVGRVAEIAGIRAPLVEQGARLVTLTGAGGVGKTRLALAAADGLRCPDGAWLVELAGLDRTATAADIADRVMTTLGLCESTSTPETADLVECLVEAAAGKDFLLVLDNCEHLLEQVAALAERLLAGVPGAQLLLTSREPLDVPGEVVRPVPPLELPDDAAAREVLAAARFSAVELFVQRAAAAVPGFALDAGNVRAVSAICRRLDGIPLALELVAPRLRMFEPEHLADSLDDRFSLPSGAGRGRPSRQQTLRAMIDWSWELLGRDERIVLRRLAVHADGCTLRAAQSVCSDQDIPAPRVLELLARLVDRSLVVRDGDRFRLLESVSAYSAERLAEAGERDAVRDRFVHHYLELAERADRELRGPEQQRHLARLDAETANLRRALDLAIQGEQAEAALRLVNALTWYWYLRGRHGEARRSLQAALATDGGAPALRAAARGWLTGVELRSTPNVVPVPDLAAITDPVLHARLQWFIGSGLLDDVEHDLGVRMLEQGLLGARAHRDRWTEAAVLVEIRTDVERAAEVFGELGDRWGQLRAARCLAELAETDGDRSRAARMHREGLRSAEDLALWTEVVESLCRLGKNSLDGGNPAQARQFSERALRISTDHSYHCGVFQARRQLDAITRAEPAWALLRTS